MNNYLSAAPEMIATVGLDDAHHCATCGYQNPDNIVICLNCAAPLGIHCFACGQIVPAGDKFCRQCGARILESQIPSAASRRQDEVLQNLRALMPTTLANKISAASGEILGENREVTVLAGRIVNFNAVPLPLDDEDSHFLIDEALRLLVEVVYKYEGTVDRFTPDGLMALFGAPVAHENDPERAVRAALEMQATIQSWQMSLKQEHDLIFQVRFGLNTGLVIAGKIGNNLHMDYTVIGETVNLARQLEETAEADTILVSAETYRRTRSLFEFGTVPLTTDEWLVRPIQAYQPLGVLEEPRWVRDTLGLQVPMIGRANDLTQLQNALDEVRQLGQSRVVFLTGEAGVGKSRLVAEFRRSLDHSTARVYQGSCLAYARSTPLWVVAAVLRDIMQLPETMPGEAQQETLQTYLSQLGLTNKEILPYLMHVLGLEQTDPRIKARLQLLDATMLQRQTHAALRQVFLAEARQREVVLIFEDLHWVDPASRDFLDYLLHTTADAPLLLVFVGREAGRRTVLGSLLAAAKKEPGRLIDLQLHALSKAEGQLLADHLIRQPTPKALALKHRIVERAEGNPFYIEEIIRMLIDQGGLIRNRADGSWQVTVEANQLIKAVPGTLKGLILTRFDRLPEGLRQILQKAAVLGASFPVDLLQHLSNTDPEILTEQLNELETRQFLVAKPFRSGQGYAFRHALLHETIYSTLLKRDRRKIHTTAAEAIERSAFWLPEEQAETLAYHYAESATPTKAVPYLITAAENAARRCAYETVIEHYRQAMTLIPDQPDDRSDAIFWIGIGLGRSLKFVGEFAAANQVLSETLQRVWSWSLATDPGALGPILVKSLRQLADIRQREGAYDEALAYLEAGLQVLGEARPHEQPTSWCSLVDRMAWIRFRQGHLEEAFELANSALAALNSEATDEVVRLASLYNTLGGISWQQGQPDEAVTYVERCLDLYESVGYLWGMATAYGNLGVLYYDLGNWLKAADYYEQAYAMQQVIGNPEGQANSFDNLGILHTALGEHEVAQQELEAGLSIRQKLGDAWGTAQSHVNLARLAIIRSHFKEAATQARTALNISHTIGSSEIQVEVHWILALVQAENDDLQTALQTVEQALEVVQTTGLMEKEIDCLRVLGVLRSRAGQYAEAETTIRASVDLSKKQNDPYQQGLGLLELGRVYQCLSLVDPSNQAEWQTKAVTSLDQAIEQFEALGAAHDLQLAQTALDQIYRD